METTYVDRHEATTPDQRETEKKKKIKEIANKN